ncbi:hypothetical protein PG997_011565 [Apiospora hydei]|uniref:Uncharacterized protein n=1 Tax=Apiospora hydei TaxID=1337664 RepID=A0ABR1VKE2_9PEZI
MLRDTRHHGVPLQKGFYLDDSDRSKRLRQVRVRIGGVLLGQEGGNVGIATDADGRSRGGSAAAGAALSLGAFNPMKVEMFCRMEASSQ